MFENLRVKEAKTIVRPEILTGDFYDDQYFDGTGKSNYDGEYTWEKMSKLFNGFAQFLTEGFPLCPRVLDVGCAKGFLVKALNDTRKKNDMPSYVRGFDVSKYAIDNCHPDAKGLVSVFGVEDYKFTEKFDLMVISETLEHLSVEQIRHWLTYSREFIADSVFATIPFKGDPKADDEPSHISLYNRAWWHDMFTSCGWVHSWEAGEQEKEAANDPLVKQQGWNVFIYRCKKGIY